MWKFRLVLLLVSGVAVQEAMADCGVCNSNGVACINKTAFHLCIDGEPIIGQAFNCPQINDVCTKLTTVCVPEVYEKATCGDDSECGVCDGQSDGTFTCTSRTTYSMCFNGEISTVKEECAPGEVCLVSLAKQGEVPCVNNCQSDVTDMCDVAYPVDAPPTTVPPTTTTVFQPTPTNPPTTDPPTTAPPTTDPPTTAPPITNPPITNPPITNPPPTDLNAFCQSRNMVGRFDNPDDPTCTSYINCLLSGGAYIGRIINCPQGRYFHANSFHTTKPIGCV